MCDEQRSSTVSLLLDETKDDAERISCLLPMVYDQLRAAAQRALATERSDHTLQATAIVHEAYLRLVGDRKLPWANRAHFYAAAAESMRRVLLDHAKSRGRKKRGGDKMRVTLNDVFDLAPADSSTILAVDEAICRLGSEHAQAGQVVRLRFYAGLSIDDTASALGISPRQVNRLWTFSRAWLFRLLREDLA